NKKPTLFITNTPRQFGRDRSGDSFPERNHFTVFTCRKPAIPIDHFMLQKGNCCRTTTIPEQIRYKISHKYLPVNHSLLTLLLSFCPVDSNAAAMSAPIINAR